MEEVTAETKQEIKEKLDAREQFYICKFNTLAPSGYNVRLGGEEGSIFSKESKVCATGSEHFNWRTDLND
mgnify:FL=1